MVRTLIAAVLAGALLIGCHFEESGLSWGPDAATSDDPDPTDPGSPDARPSVDAIAPPDVDAAPICEDPLVACPDGCVDVDSDDHNCGDCGHKCRKDEVCDQGDCVR